MHQRLCHFLGLLLAAGACDAAITQQWLVQLPGFTPARVLPDPSGNVLVCGTQFGTGNSTSGMAVYAYSPTGQRLWSWTSGTAGADSLADAALDAQGNIILAGNRGASWRIVKLNAQRQVLWGTTYVPPNQLIADDVVNRVITDQSGRVYVAGYTLGDIGEDARVTAFSPAGSALWTQVRGIEERWDRFENLALDPRGGVVAVGEVGDDEIDGRLKFCIVNFDGAGNERWSHYLLGVFPPDQQGFFEGGDALNVAVDNAGNTYASGLVTDDQLFNDIFIARVAPGGSITWSDQWDGPDGQYDRAYDMALAGDRLYLTGETFRGWNHDYFDIPLLAYDTGGARLWQDTFNSPLTANDSEDVSLNVRSDEFGRVVMIGSDWTKPGYDYIVRVLSRDGQLLDHLEADVPVQEFDVDRRRCAELLPGGRLVFAGTGGGFGPIGPRTATIGMLDLGTPGGGCAADFNQDGGVDGQDVEAFYLAWQDADARADMNQDGGVDGADVEAFYLAWEAGC